MGRFFLGGLLACCIHWSTCCGHGLHSDAARLSAGTPQPERQDSLCRTSLGTDLRLHLLVPWDGMYHTTAAKRGPLSDWQYIMYHSDHWLNLRQLWTNWPDREMRGLFKWYYLVQFAFWVQQIVVVHIEKRRKDHWQMFTHHVITCILMFTSYGYHQSKVGNTILCLMDAVDILFAVSCRPAVCTPSGLGMLTEVDSACQITQIP